MESSTVRELEQKCLSYLQFIEDTKVDLFHKFKKTGSGTYELPIASISNNNETYQLLCEFINKYRDTCRPHYTLDFDWGLSSGEENMLRIFTWLHHIFPLDVTDGKCVIRNRESGSNDTICDSILLFMDEADLTLHPEWQREFINVLTTYIPILYPTAVAKDIQIVLSTHSPLLLGDIPSENVAYLKSDGQSEKSFEISTFGQNIHTILKDSFFLSNGVGEFAKGKINNAAQKLRDKISGKEDVSPQELAECKAIIDLVSPGVIKSKLLELYDEATGGSDRSVKIVQGYIDTMSTEQLKAMADAFQAEIERRKK